MRVALDGGGSREWLLARAERRTRVAGHFARVILKGPTRTGSHLLPEILRDHIFAVPGAMAKPRSRSDTARSGGVANKAG